MNNNSQSFPQRVYNVLNLCEEQGRQDIMSWEENGTAFKVNDLDAFERELLPNHFNTKKYYSFTRALHAYGFACTRTGRQTGIYSHPSFNRADSTSPSLMTRVSKRKNKKPPAMDHTISNLPFENPDNCPPPNPMPSAVSKNQQIRNKFPPVHDERMREDDTVSVFCREYHTVGASQADFCIDNIPSGSELVGAFDGEGDESAVGTIPYPDPIAEPSSTNSTPFHVSTSYDGTRAAQQRKGKPGASDGSLVILETRHIRPIEAPPRESMGGSGQGQNFRLIPAQAPHRNSRLQDSNSIHIMNLVPPKRKDASGGTTRHSGNATAPSRFGQGQPKR